MSTSTRRGRPGALAATAVLVLGIIVISLAAAQATPDPCTIVSKDDVASAAGVAVDQVYAPTEPNKNECVWAVAAHGGLPAQRIAFTMQTVDKAKAAHGIARFGAVLGALGNIPGVTLPSDPVVTRALADAQVVTGLGDRAGWKNGTLSVLKNEMLYAVTSTGQASDAESLRVSRAVAQSVLTHTDVSATPRPAQ